MRKLTAGLALAIGLALAPGEASAETVHAMPAVSVAASAAASTVKAGDGAQTVALGSTMQQHQKAQAPSRRRYRTQRRRHRGIMSRIFGFIGFLMCLPFLLILVALLVFMSRRNRRRQQEQMYYYDNNDNFRR